MVLSFYLPSNVNSLLMNLHRNLLKEAPEMLNVGCDAWLRSNKPTIPRV
jgi:hypothetical protein